MGQVNASKIAAALSYISGTVINGHSIVGLAVVTILRDADKAFEMKYGSTFTGDNYGECSIPGIGEIGLAAYNMNALSRIPEVRSLDINAILSVPEMSVLKIEIANYAECLGAKGGNGYQLPICFDDQVKT